MPTNYKRKTSSTRGSWSEENLVAAIQAVKNGSSIKRAAENFGIPRKTLERRLKRNDPSKGRMGPDSLFGQENERKLVKHIKKMQKSGFPSLVDDVRRAAYFFAEQLKLPHKFNKEKERAGYDWFNSFLRRHPDLSLRKTEGVSIARGQGMNREDVGNHFKRLEACLEENGLFNKPGCIYNVDETGLQLNNRASVVVAEKGSKNVSTTTCAEKGETISCITCCNAEGTFLPPVCVFKGKYKKAEYEDNMPPGAVVLMSEKSAYVNTEIFTTWLRDHFIPRKPLGKVLLILDGHASHCSSVELLELARDNDVVLLCLPSHTTHYLQPLDRAVFKSLKTFFYGACQQWVRANPGRKLSRLQFGQMLSEGWGKACTVSNAVAGFKATGIFPFQPSAIPEHAFLISDAANVETNRTETSSVSLHCQNPSEPQPSTSGVKKSNLVQAEQSTVSALRDNVDLTEEVPFQESATEDMTPGKLLDQISPVPALPARVKKATRNLGGVLTSPEYIEKRVEKARKKKQTEERKQGRKQKQPKKIFIGRNKRAADSSSESETNMILDSEEEEENFDENECVGCLEDYFKTQRKEDWIKCVKCLRWLHEQCTSFANMCMRCGRKHTN